MFAAGTASADEIHGLAAAYARDAAAHKNNPPLYWTAPNWLRESFPGLSIELEDAVLRKDPRLHTALWEVDEALQAGPETGVSPADFHRASGELADQFGRVLDSIRPQSVSDGMRARR